jgi:hypothetical protein
LCRCQKGLKNNRLCRCQKGLKNNVIWLLISTGKHYAGFVWWVNNCLKLSADLCSGPHLGIIGRSWLIKKSILMTFTQKLCTTHAWHRVYIFNVGCFSLQKHWRWATKYGHQTNSGKTQLY